MSICMQNSDAQNLWFDLVMLLIGDFWVLEMKRKPISHLHPCEGHPVTKRLDLNKLCDSYLNIDLSI